MAALSGLLIFLGLTNAAGRAYSFWSGSGSVLLPWLMQAMTLVLLLWWHHQCHVHRCYWYARRTTAAGARVCGRHFPGQKLTHKDIIRDHEAALKSRGQI